MSPNMEISTVVGCRMGCGYCPQKAHVKRYTEKSRETVMSWDTFKTCMMKIPRHVEIVFAGMAEPFLNPLAMTMIACATLSHKVGIYTTLVGAGQDHIKVLATCNIMFLTIHLPDAEGVMKMEVTDNYLKTLKDAMQLPHNLMCIGEVHPKVKEITGYVRDDSTSLLSRAGNIKSLAIDPKNGKLECSACGPKIDHNILLPSGEVLLCCMDYRQEHVLGNLLTDSYDQLFESEEYKKIQAGLDDDFSDIICRKCEISKVK